jgi:hypothetical protein
MCPPLAETSNYKCGEVANFAEYGGLQAIAFFAKINTVSGEDTCHEKGKPKGGHSKKEELLHSKNIQVLVTKV